MGNDLNKCMTKFDVNKAKLRRAFSLEEISEHGGEESDEEEKLASASQGCGFIDDPETGKRRFMRRYSFPMSPRTLAGVPRAEFTAQLK